ncbi:hypothetical protein H6F76_07350 [Leptolyngbya sp. FACHB-321]|uniref:hypothetical protein n=1 Tax=Leptolyngbya sp. FACHB-321 TaxID=2692807 RepID=UPI001684E541|nr:hypothetical protein [Leptolyngbya sp. FACHB-321]MBD2034849.1 hypothetical protein [Leptolyngbya sp. FACHB-321]
MTAALVSDFSITLNQRRWACVLDPTLALSHYGLPLVKQLGELMELWIVRELWHILDNPQFYLHQPSLISSVQMPIALPSYGNSSQHVVQTLKEWERLRTSTDRNSWNIHFLADVIGESCVPTGIDADIIWRWESLAQSLDTRLDQQVSKPDILTLAFRDLAALAAARPACILTHCVNEEAPALCKTLQQWGIACQPIEPTNAIADIEREQFRNLLVHAGLSKFLWAGLNLAVLHLVVPAAATLSTTFAQDWSDEYSFSEIDESTVDQGLSTNLWQGAQGFWYSIT